MGNKTTKLDTLIAEAVGLTRELENLNADSKLSFKAFFAEALHIADCDEKRLAVVEGLIKKNRGTESIQIFLRRYAKVLSESSYPRPSDDANRVLRIYGSEELLPEATQYGIKAGELQALAVCVCFDRYGDQAFGKVVDRANHEKKTSTARTRLESIHEEMRRACTNNDLIFDDTYPAVLPSQKEAGLCKVSFKRAPDISPSMGDWPRELVAASAPKPTRARLTKAA